MRGGHQCVAYDHAPEATQALVNDGAVGAQDLGDLIARLETPRVVWLMLSAGKITEDTLGDLHKLLSKDDVVIDGGNSFYKDDIRRAGQFSEHASITSMSARPAACGVCARGYCMMIGGEDEVVRRIDPILATLALGRGDIPETPDREGRDERVENGYMHCGPVGSEHFVKMVHNGIEYGLMQTYAEGFHILRHKDSKDVPESERYELDVADIAEVWQRGSMVSSWLFDLTQARWRVMPLWIVIRPR